MAGRLVNKTDRKVRAKPGNLDIGTSQLNKPLNQPVAFPRMTRLGHGGGNRPFSGLLGAAANGNINQNGVAYSLGR